MISTKNLDVKYENNNPGTNMMKTQHELFNLKKQIGNLDKVKDAQSYYYSLQRNIEVFEKQLERQMDNINKDNSSLPNVKPSINLYNDEQVKRKNIAFTKAADQYKGVKRREPSEVKRRRQLKVIKEKESEEQKRIDCELRKKMAGGISEQHLNP